MHDSWFNLHKRRDLRGAGRLHWAQGLTGKGPGPLAGSRHADLIMLVRRPNAVTWTDMVTRTVIDKWPNPPGARVRVRIEVSGWRRPAVAHSHSSCGT